MARATASALARPRRARRGAACRHGRVVLRRTRSTRRRFALTDKVALLEAWSERLLRSRRRRPRDRLRPRVTEDKFFADLAGSRHRPSGGSRVHPVRRGLRRRRTDRRRFESMRTLAPPVGRGWEYLTGERVGLATRSSLPIPDLLAAKVAAPWSSRVSTTSSSTRRTCGSTIHESIGHATEFDRALGYEAAYAGTSFATFDKLGTLQYGSEIMNVTGDRTVDHGLATVGFDDEGSAASASTSSATGCSSATSSTGAWRSRTTSGAPTAVPSPTRRCTSRSSAWPTFRCSRRTATARPPTELIAGVDRGHLRSRRQELVDRHAAPQLPVHRAALLPHRARKDCRASERRRLPVDDHRLLGIARGASAAAPTYVLGGAFNCGKGQPGQVGSRQPRLPVGALPTGQGAERPGRGRCRGGGVSGAKASAGLQPPGTIVGGDRARANLAGCRRLCRGRRGRRARPSSGSPTTRPPPTACGATAG